MRALLLTLLLGFYTSVMAEVTDDTGRNTEIPTTELEFVESINQFSKAQIIEQFGEPAVMDDLRLADTGEVIASIWRYHFINTNPDGEYYETTELDFLGERVVTVVFINNGGQETITIEPPDLPLEDEPAPEFLL
jgi:hypothetical protein